ncbi:MAG: tRNA (guanine(46)-N(7))-methyltransferase TrmB [Pseudomonadota bacterium]
MPPDDRRGRQLHGRRRGHRLSARRQHLVDELLPRVAVAPEPAILTSEVLFGRPCSVWLEIGFGAGEHLAWQAERHPDIGFIGAEPYINGVATLLASVDDGDLDNIRVVPDDIRPVLERLTPGMLDRAFVLFPDPWPKTRHLKRRLVDPRLVARLADLLADGAELRLATDDMSYARQILQVTTANPAFRWKARRPGDWRHRSGDWPETRYEAKAVKAGRSPVYLIFERCRRCRA